MIDFLLDIESILSEYKIEISSDISPSNFKTTVIEKLFLNTYIDPYTGLTLLRSSNKEDSNTLITLNNVIYTPMRELNNRYESLERFSFNEDGVWLTQTLSGCSILFIEWFDNSYSMIHLRPQIGRVPSEFSSGKIRQFMDNQLSRKYKDNTNFDKENSLLFECAKICYNSSKNIFDQPYRYFLFQSGYQTTNHREISNIFVTKLGGNLEIYIQNYNFLEDCKKCEVSIGRMKYYLFSSITPYYGNSKYFNKETYIECLKRRNSKNK